METPRIFIMAKLSIRELGSSSVLMIISTDEDPSSRIESFAIINIRGVSTKRNLGPVYMEDGLARLARQPGKLDEFLLCLYEKISSRLPGQFCYIDVVLTVVKNSLRRYL